MNLARFALAGFGIVAVALTGFGIFRAVSEQRESEPKESKAAAEEAARDRQIAIIQAQQAADSGGASGWENFGDFLRTVDEVIIRVATALA